MGFDHVDRAFAPRRVVLECEDCGEPATAGAPGPARCARCRELEEFASLLSPEGGE